LASAESTFSILMEIFLQAIDTTALGGINSVAVKNGLAAVAITAPVKTDSGLVRFHDTALDRRSDTDKLSRLNFALGSGDLNNEGDLDRLEVFGGRSFSILDANGNIVFDSGDEIEQIIKNYFPNLWDDSRSDNKGPEPESVATGHVNGLDLLFVGLERSNAVMIWDLTSVNDPRFLDMIFTPGDVGPEGLSFFSNASGSYLAVANEVSETTSLYRLHIPDGDPSTAWLLMPALVGMYRFVRRSRV